MKNVSFDMFTICYKFCFLGESLKKNCVCCDVELEMVAKNKTGKTINNGRKKKKKKTPQMQLGKCHDFGGPRALSDRR